MCVQTKRWPMVSRRRTAESIFASIPSIQEVQHEMDSAGTELEQETKRKRTGPTFVTRERRAAEKRDFEQGRETLENPADAEQAALETAEGESAVRSTTPALPAKRDSTERASQEVFSLSQRSLKKFTTELPPETIRLLRRAVGAQLTAERTPDTIYELVNLFIVKGCADLGVK